MKPNAKMVLFFVGATLFNILLMAVLVVGFIWLIAKAVGSSGNQNLFTILMFASFIASIVITFWLYGVIMKKVTVRFKLETQIPQLFKTRKK